MSYVVTNFYENPGPYYGTSDKDEPVPGWGPLPVMAGGERVGVGQMTVTAHPATTRLAMKQESKRKDGPAVSGWIWVLGAGVVGAAIGIARNRGMLRRVGLRP